MFQDKHNLDFRQGIADATVYCKCFNFRRFWQANIFAGINFHDLKKMISIILCFKSIFPVLFFMIFRLNSKN